MTAADMFRDARWGGLNRHSMALAGARATITPLYSASRPTNPCRFPASVARLPAFTVDLDLKRLDIGLAAAMGKHRGMGG